MTKKVGAIILAAGSSRRFNFQDKRKQELPSGKTILLQVIDNVAAVIDRVLVVLRFGDANFEQELATHIDDSRVELFRAPDSAVGMAHSLGNAVRHVRGDWDAALVALGDMPFVQPSTIKALVDKYREIADTNPIIYPTHSGQSGHPVLFPSVYFDEIEGLTGDVGAKSVVKAHADDVIEVEVPDAGILRDIDTPGDLER